MSWASLIEQRKTMRLFGWLMLGAGLLTSPFIVWEPEIRLACVVFMLSGTYCHSAALMLGRMADLQAAIDMKKIMFDARVSKRLPVNPDDIITFQAGATIRVSHYTTIEVI